MDAGDAAHDRQAEAGPFDGPRVGRVAPEEAVEEPVGGLARDPGAGIGHLDHGVAVVVAHLDVDAALVGELDRVVDQVAHELAQQAGVADDDRAGIGRRMRREHEAVGSGALLRVRDHVVDQPFDDDGLFGDRVARLGLRERQHPGHHPRQPPALLRDRLDTPVAHVSEGDEATMQQAAPDIDLYEMKAALSKPWLEDA